MTTANCLFCKQPFAQDAQFCGYCGTPTTLRSPVVQTQEMRRIDTSRPRHATPKPPPLPIEAPSLPDAPELPPDEVIELEADDLIIDDCADEDADFVMVFSPSPEPRR